MNLDNFENFLISGFQQEMEDAFVLWIKRDIYILQNIIKENFQLKKIIDIYK